MRDRSKPYSLVASGGVAVAVAAALTGILSGVAYQTELLSLREAFDVLRWSAYGGVVAVLVSLVGVVLTWPGSRRRGLWLGIFGVALGAIVFWLPYNQQQLARSVPAIHDITTDFENPPEFRAVAALRPSTANSLAYAGDTVASKQRHAYPDIQPLVVDLPRQAVFDSVVETARDMGWHIVDSSVDIGLLEAVDTTLWFGFKDDVVVRVIEVGDGVRVDVRSVSRVGRSDIGKNAERVRAFLTRLRTRLGD